MYMRTSNYGQNWLKRHIKYCFLGVFCFTITQNIGCSHDIIALFHNFQSPTGRCGVHVLFIIFDEFVAPVIKGLDLAIIFRCIKVFKKLPI